MAQARCPHCLHQVEVPDFLAFGLLRCPECREAYSYQPEAAPEPAAAPPSSAQMLASILAEPPRPPAPPAPTRPPAPTPPARTGPRLVSPHTCQHCWKQMPDGINKPAATVTCPGCRNKTSVYAIQFRCQACAELLEAPKRLAEEKRPCPCCAKGLTIPRLVLEEVSDDADDLEAFVCECPSCRKRVVARREEVGRNAVCPLCRVVVVVPAYGTTARRSAPPAEEPAASLQAGHEVACRACRCHIPSTAARCPICGHANTPSEYP